MKQQVLALLLSSVSTTKIEQKGSQFFAQTSAQSSKEFCLRTIAFWQDQTKVETTWTNAQASTELFVDQDFKTNTDSIWVQGTILGKKPKDIERFKRINLWKRPSKLLNQKSRQKVCTNLGCFPKSDFDTLGPEECKNENCSDYRGRQQFTRDGKKCATWGPAWANSKPKQQLVKNYCRNVNGDDPNLWCMTEDGGFGNCDPMKSAPTETVLSDTSADAPKTPQLWGKGGVSPAGVSQGNLGNCWFLAASAAIAGKADRIKKIFTNTEYPANGAFELIFYNMNRPTKIVIDDQLPINPDTSDSPEFANVSKNGGWWMPILEKAYAKFSVAYANLGGGLAANALQELTNMPVMTYETKDQDMKTIFDTIHTAKGKDYIMTGWCSKTKHGITRNHIFSVMDAVHLNLDDGTTVDLIKVRNPWGSEDYKGPWGDKDPRWTDALRTQIGGRDANDGLFFIPLALFKELFPLYDVAMYRDWQLSTYRHGPKANKHIKTFTSSVEQEAVIQIMWIAGERCPRNGCYDHAEYNKVDVEMKVTNKSTGESYTPISRFSSKYKFVHFPKLPAGQTIEVEIEVWSPEHQDFDLTLFAADSMMALE